MASICKLSAFRQLSLNCESPTAEQRRKSFKKQLSEDFPDVKSKFAEYGAGGRTRDRPHPVKIAWAEEIEPNEEGVIVKKCTKELKRPSHPPKLTRHSSLEKDSILYSKQELADRLRLALKQKEQEKPNLKIFLAQNSIDETNDNDFYDLQDAETTQKVPKLMPSLLNTEGTIKNVFQIRKNRNVADSAATTTTKSSAVVVIPLADKEDNQLQPPPPQILSPSTSPRESNSDPKAINHVIIRPSTAAAKRDSFKKRTNSAFNSISKEDRPRPPLVRSASAPSRPQEQQTTKPKFLSTKRKIKSGKRKEIKLSNVLEDEEGSNKENPKSKKEMNRYVAVNGTEIVTMVSLISPAASDSEEVAETEPVQKCEKEKGSPVKGSIVKKEEKDGGKNVSLRKTVKSVSFQQSSIHAIRSFSASFPARRGSMATALTLSSMKQATNHKGQQEKRATNSVNAEDEERGPKRRLVRSATVDSNQSSKTIDPASEPPKNANDKAADSNIKVDISSKKIAEVDATPPPTQRQSIPDDNKINNDSDIASDLNGDDNNAEGNQEPKFGSTKEKQCWDMFCKMTDRGISVSYDTILRGMLTPTEYRMRKKEVSASTSSEEAPVNN